MDVKTTSPSVVVAARGLFAQRGYAATELEEIGQRAAAYVLVGALEEAATAIAGSEDPLGARAEMGRMVQRLLSGLRAPIG